MGRHKWFPWPWSKRVAREIEQATEVVQPAVAIPIETPVQPPPPEVPERPFLEWLQEGFRLYMERIYPGPAPSGPNAETWAALAQAGMLRIPEVRRFYEYDSRNEYYQKESVFWAQVNTKFPGYLYVPQYEFERIKNYFRLHTDAVREFKGVIPPEVQKEIADFVRKYNVRCTTGSTQDREHPPAQLIAMGSAGMFEESAVRHMTPRPGGRFDWQPVIAYEVHDEGMYWSHGYVIVATWPKEYKNGN